MKKYSIKSPPFFMQVLSLIIPITLFFIHPLLSAQKTILETPINSINDQIAGKLSDSSKLLVLDIQDPDGRATYFGKYLSDRLSIGLANKGKFQVLDRQNMEPLFQERKLADVGLIDEKSAVRFGKMLGANSVVYGTVTEFEKNIGINLKIVNIEKGVMIGGVYEEMPKSRGLSSLIGTITRKEKEKEEEIERQKRQVEAEIEAGKNQVIQRVKQDELKKKGQLPGLENELREKSEVIAKYNRLEEQNRKADEISKKVMREIQSEENVLFKLTEGMTLEEVKEILGNDMSCPDKSTDKLYLCSYGKRHFIEFSEHRVFKKSRLKT